MLAAVRHQEDPLRLVEVPLALIKLVLWKNRNTITCNFDRQNQTKRSVLNTYQVKRQLAHLEQHDASVGIELGRRGPPVRLEDVAADVVGVLKPLLLQREVEGGLQSFIEPLTLKSMS